jgi:hypothetical protein
MKKPGFYFHVAAAVTSLILGGATTAFSDDLADVPASQPDRLIHQEAASRDVDPFDGISFPTIYSSGFDACTNSDGKPVILLFSSSSCSHCAWVGEIFDAIVGYYVEDGLIEAHHFDRPTGDDLLTEEIETEIPEEFIGIYDRGNPKHVVPYLNLSCKYERIGNGYEKTQDAESEAREMIEAIEILIQALPGDGGE